MSKIKTLANNINNWFTALISNIFEDRKKTMKAIAIIVFSILFLLETGMILINNSFYNNASDDILQYYTIMVDFIGGLKEGTVSWFNLNNYFGASFFSDVYYIPIDLFTGITFFLSYLMPIEVAYSVTELIKIFVGVMLFAYYLSLKGMKNRTIFWISIMYFINGGTVSFMAFPVFLSLTVYMPLALIVIHYFFRKKRWIVPLFAMACIFYDFYLGYTLMAFSAITYVIEYFKEPDFRFFRFVKDSIIFVGLLLLGVLMAAVIAYPSIVFILEETYRRTVNFDAWVINIFGFDLKFFQPNIYIRLLAKMFVEQKPIGFYGFENSYATEHFSLYISIIGFAYMNYIYFMKDKISKLYKIIIPIALIFIFVPLFSYVFSGTTDAPYTRWINMLPIFELMILAHVFDKYGFEEVKMKYMTIIIGVLLAVVGGLMYYYIVQLKQDYYLASRDVLTADTVLMGVSAIYLIILLIFGWLKKWRIVKLFFWVEFVVAIFYAYSGPLSIVNKINTFENAHDIEAYLDDVIQDDQFFRVYVDINNLKVEDTNFNRMTGYVTNTGIFHSWTDEETNDIGYLLFGDWEYQSKNNMNTFDYYLSHFLGYKYLLLDADSDYSLDGEQFELYAANSQYKLYKLVDASPFKIYESYVTYEEFLAYNDRNSDMATEKVLLMAAIIDAERYVVEDLNLEHVVVADESPSNSLTSYQMVNDYEEVIVPGLTDTTERLFYKYSNDDLDIDYSLGAVYIKGSGLAVESYGEAYMEFSDGSTKTCWIQSGVPHHIKCEFFKTPTAIYIEDTGDMDSGPSLQVRQERAINGAAYLVYDLSAMNIQSDSGIISFTVNASFAFNGRTFVVDVDGNEHECINGFYSFDTEPDKLYIYKTSKMYEYYNLFLLTIGYSYDDLADSSSLLNQDYANGEYLTINNGKINIQYFNASESEYDQLVVIPVAYSDDWVITSEVQYETMSTSGGFLGIIVPSGTAYINITMEFQPTGIGIGALASLGSVMFYLVIFLPTWIKKRKNGDDIL